MTEPHQHDEAPALALSVTLSFTLHSKKSHSLQSEKSKVWHQFLIFSLNTPQDRGLSLKPEAELHHFFMPKPPTWCGSGFDSEPFLAYRVKKIYQIWYQFLIYNYIGKRIRGRTRRPALEQHLFFMPEPHQHDAAPVLVSTSILWRIYF
jgi:hypothetical protein